MARILSAKTKIKRYEKAILEILADWKDYLKNYANDYQVIIDKTHRHYLFVENTWSKEKYRHNVMFHFSLREDGKVLLRLNETKDDLAVELMKKGVAAQDIVLMMQPEKVRELTGYGS